MKNQKSEPKIILQIGRMRNGVVEPFLREPLKEMSFPSLDKACAYPLSSSGKRPS